MTTTVADFITADMGVSLWCQDCRRGAVLDLTTLPPELELYKRPHSFVCSICKGRNVLVSIHGSRALRAKGEMKSTAPRPTAATLQLPR